MAKTILIVEDEQNIVDILSFNLSGRAIDPGGPGRPHRPSAGPGAEPDLILLDLMLPGMGRL